MVAAAVMLLAAGCCGRAQRGARPGRDAAPSPADSRAASPSIPPPKWMRTASLEGEVRAGDLPLSEAEVSLGLLLGPRALELGRAHTDRRGRFSFKEVPPGAARLVVGAPGRASRQVVLWLEERRNRAPPLDLYQAAPLAGRVVDDRGRPVKGARVEAAPSAGGGWTVDATTDAGGRFRLEGLRGGAYRLEATAPGHQAAVEPEAVAPSDQIRLRVARRYEIRGQLSGPVRIATIRLAGSGIWPARRIRSAADGSFRFDGVPAGVYEVVAHAETAPWAASEILAGVAVGPEAPPPIELLLHPVAPLRGVVVDGEDKPVQGAELMLGSGALSVLQSRAKSDDKGRFAFPPAAGSDLRLNVWAKGFLPEIDLQVAPVGEDLRRIVLKRGATLAGDLVDSSGAPVSGALVWVTYRLDSKQRPQNAALGGHLGVTSGPVPPIPAAGSPLPLAPPAPSPAGSGLGVGAALSDASGRFTVFGLAPGEVQVSAEHRDYSRTSSGWVALVAGQPAAPVRLTMTVSSRISGRILDEQARPVAGAQVIARGATGEPRLTESDAWGSYRIRGLSGRVTVAATRGGYLPATRTVRLEPGRAHELDLVLEPARGELRGVVVDPSGRGVAGVRVTLRNPSGQLVAAARSDPNGAFELSGVGSRSLTLEISHPGYLAVARTVRPDQRDLEVALQYPAALAVHVLDQRSGAPIERFELAAASSQGPPRRAAVKSARDGRFRLTGLTPGLVTLRVDAPGYAVATRTVKLSPPDPRGEAAADWVEVSLQAAGALEGVLTDLSGSPLSGASLGAAGVQGRSGSDGGFRIARIPEGSHVVDVVTSDGRRLRTDPVAVRGGETQAGLRLIAR